MVRIKNRYLLVNILYPALDAEFSNTNLPDVANFHQPTTDALTQHALQRGIEAEVHSLFGEYGSGVIKSSLQVKYWSNPTSTFILRVSRDHYRIAWMALTFMTHQPIKDGKPCVFTIRHVSGTIRKSQDEMVRRARETMLRVQREAESMGKAQASELLDRMFGTNAVPATDTIMADRIDSEGEDEDEISDG